mgnify:CR=1 FL=1
MSQLCRYWIFASTLADPFAASLVCISNRSSTPALRYSKIGILDDQEFITFLGQSIEDSSTKRGAATGSNTFEDQFIYFKEDLQKNLKIFFTIFYQFFNFIKLGKFEYFLLNKIGKNDSFGIKIEENAS